MNLLTSLYRSRSARPPGSCPSPWAHRAAAGRAARQCPGQPYAPAHKDQTDHVPHGVTTCA